MAVLGDHWKEAEGRSVGLLAPQREQLHLYLYLMFYVKFPFKNEYVGKEGWIGRAQRVFKGSKTILYGTVMVAICHHAFAQTHRMYYTKRELLCKL